MENRTDYSNIPASIEAKLGRSLHNQKGHPIEIIKNKIYQYFDQLPEYQFQKHDDLDPIVDTNNNFDLLLIPPDHPARRKSDTFYVNQNTVLRTHTSAHQNQLIEKGIYNFLVTGDVYRKDEIDSCHYPIFHQMEGVGLVPEGADPQEELLKILQGLVAHLFPNCESRVNDDYFPFTEPSFEIEVKYQDKWLEILGCGVVHPQILAHHQLSEQKLWAFGLGLERLCMILYSIPDIRYFWSTHPRFLEQFTADQEQITFQPFSTLPSITHDVSFWIPSEMIKEIPNEKGELETRWLEDNDFYQIVRDRGDEWIKLVELKDEFFHPKKQLHSKMFRITYDPIDPNLKDGSEFKGKVMEMHEVIRKQLADQLNITLR